MTPRHLLMAAGLIGASALVLWGDNSPADTPASAAARPALPTATAQSPALAGKPASTAGRTVPDSSILLVQGRRDLLAPSLTDAHEARAGQDIARAVPFASASWGPAVGAPAVLPPQVQVPAAPSVPALPFTVLGKALSNNVWEVFLANGASTYVVREHSTVDDHYRIDSIQPPTMQLTYLPMNTVQQLDIGAAQ